MAPSFVHVHLSALRYFSETVRSGSMRQAGERLSVAASAVNRQIVKLEDQLQAKLFERNADGVRLTTAGEILFDYVKRLDRDLDRAISQIDDLRGLRRGHVHIACEDGIGRDFLPSVLASFNAEFPGVTFSVEIASAQEILRRVAEDETDIGLSMTPPTRPDVAVAARAALPLGAIMPPGSPLSQRKSLKLQDLLGERFIQAKDGMGGVTGFYARLRHHAPNARLIETNAPDFITNLVSAGLGIGIRSPVGIMGDIERGSLAFVPISDKLVNDFAMSVNVRPQRILPNAGSILLERLCDSLSSFQARVWKLVGVPSPGSAVDAAGRAAGPFGSGSDQ